MRVKSESGRRFKGLTSGAARLAYSFSSLGKRPKDVSTVQAEVREEEKRSALERIVLPPLDTVSNRQLVRWMFQFLMPVKPLILAACVWLMVWVGAEVLSTRQAAD